MLKRLLVALVGMAMGGLAGLIFDLMGLGNPAILVGAALGGLIFSIAAPRVGGRSEPASGTNGRN